MPQGNISSLDRFQMKVAAFGSQSPIVRFVAKMKLAEFNLALKAAKNIDPVTENLAEWEDAPKRQIKGKPLTPPSPERIPANQGSHLLVTALKHNPRLASALGITAAAGTGLAALSGGKVEAAELPPSLPTPAVVQSTPESAVQTPGTPETASPSALSAALQYGGGAAAGAGIGALLAGKKRRTLGAIGGGVAGAGAVALARYLSQNR